LRLYLDTSLLVAAFTTEPETVRIQAWLDTRASDDLLVSDWVTTEFSAALSLKLRGRQIDASKRAEALATYSHLCIDSLTVLAVSPEQFHFAAWFADQYVVGLRGGDALHLAICANYGVTLCTLDRQLSVAGPALGVPTLLV
jgi:predicted nucleic acid-binding protein